MANTYDCKITPNGNGGNLYLGPYFVMDSDFPFDVGDEVIAKIVGDAIVIAETEEAIDELR